VAKVRRAGFWRATLVVSAMIVLSACNPTASSAAGFRTGTHPKGRQGFTSAAGPMFGDISPFFYSAQPDGTIALVGSASQLATTAHEAHLRGIKVLPTITDGSGKWMMATVILANTTSRAQHIANIVALTANPEIDGIDLDYEGFAFSDGQDSWATTQPVWVTFVTELAAATSCQRKVALGDDSSDLAGRWCANWLSGLRPSIDRARRRPAPADGLRLERQLSRPDLTHVVAEPGDRVHQLRHPVTIGSIEGATRRAFVWP